MKKLIYLISLMTLGVFLMFLYGGCESSTDPATTVATTVATTIATTIPTTATATGTGSLPAGVAGAIGNTRVALYTDLNNWGLDITFAFDACDASGAYEMAGLVPGNYFMDAWKDNDNSGFGWNSGDYVWVFGSGSYPAYTLTEKAFTLGSNIQDFVIFIIP